MKPLCLAHRGKHDGAYYENTKEAFIEAGKGAFYAIETDIHLTRDHVWITHHNDDIVSGGKHYDIGTLTLSEIMAMPLDNTQGHDQATVCLFSDYLDICKESGKRPVIEIKNNPKWKYIKEMLSYTDDVIGLSNVTIIDFYPQPLLKMKFLGYRQVHTQMLIGRHHTRMALWVAQLFGWDISIRHNLLNRKLIDKMHRRGHQVTVWTVDRKKALDRVTNLGVDYVASNVFDQNS